jgi:hypothetical protein
MDRRFAGLLIAGLALAALPALAQAPKVMTIGKDVKAGDHVTTGAGEQRALLSPDGASLMIGPNSDVGLDKFAYDPAAKRGAMALTVRAGSLRYGGGQIVKSDDVTVAAGSSQVTLHAASAAIAVRPEGAEIRMIAGERVAVSAAGSTQTLTQPDSVVYVPTNQPPSAPMASSSARPPGFGKASDLDSMTRNTNRIIENAGSQSRMPAPPPPVR